MKRCKKHKKDREWYKALDEIVLQIFGEAERRDLTDKDLSRISGLSYATILNLDNRITRYPQLRTVVMLAKGMGIKLSLDFRAKVARRDHASVFA